MAVFAKGARLIALGILAWRVGRRSTIRTRAIVIRSRSDTQGVAVARGQLWVLCSDLRRRRGRFRDAAVHSIAADRMRLSFSLFCFFGRGRCFDSPVDCPAAICS